MRWRRLVKDMWASGKAAGRVEMRSGTVDVVIQERHSLPSERLHVYTTLPSPIQLNCIYNKMLVQPHNNATYPKHMLTRSSFSTTILIPFISSAKFCNGKNDHIPMSLKASSRSDLAKRSAGTGTPHLETFYLLGIFRPLLHLWQLCLPTRHPAQEMFQRHDTVPENIETMYASQRHQHRLAVHHVKPKVTQAECAQMCVLPNPTRHLIQYCQCI